MKRNLTTRRRHALDEETPDLAGAYKSLYQALDHVVGARDGQFDFDPAVYNRHVATAADCLGGGTGKGGDSRPGARDALPADMVRSTDLDVHKLFDTGYDVDALFQREGN
jgi:hypothetical protein